MTTWFDNTPKLDWSKTMKIANNQHEQQRVTLDIVFKTHHVPFNESHVRAMLEAFFKSKGVEFNGEEIII